jgi:hypothetical protein
MMIYISPAFKPRGGPIEPFARKRGKGGEREKRKYLGRTVQKDILFEA